MKTTIYFVRHAQPDLTVREDRIRPLTAQGLEDAKKVTTALRDRNITSIYSSPFQRTMDTVKDLSNHLGIAIQPVEDFRERKVGEWVEDFKAFASQQWEDMNYKLIDGESLREVQERNVSALHHVIKRDQGNNVVIGTHGTAFCTILHYLNSSYGYDHFCSIADKMPYTVCMVFDGLELTSMEEVLMSDRLKARELS